MAKNQGQIKFGVGFNVDKSGLDQLKTALLEIKSLTASDLTKQGWDFSTATKTLKDVRKEVFAIEKALFDSFNADLGVYNIEKFKSSLIGSNTSLQQVQRTLSSIGSTGTKGFKDLNSVLITTRKEVTHIESIFDKLGQTFVNTIKWTIASSTINSITSSIQNAWNYSKKLDATLNDIMIVTDKSAEDMARFAKQANTAAKSLGAVTTDYTKASLIYYQQGLSDQEVAARTETTMKVANVTGQSADAVSEQLTAVWNGYKVNSQEAELYIDKLSAVAATTAADLEELSTGMSRVASAANIMGVDIDQLNAQLATIVSVTREAPESIGTALKTVYARMSDIEAGLDTETTLGEYTKQMAEMGINALDANGNLRDMGDVVEEIGDKWTTLNRNQQTALAQTIAGTRQYSRMMALFDNWDMYQSAKNTSQKSAGTLQNQQDEYLESTEAHLKKLQAAAEGLYDTLINSDSMNFIIDGLSHIVKLLDGMAQSLGGMGGVLGTVSGLLVKISSKSIANELNKIIDNIRGSKIEQNIYQSLADSARELEKETEDLDKELNKILKKAYEMAQVGLIDNTEVKNIENAISSLKDLAKERENLRKEQENANLILNRDVDWNTLTSSGDVTAWVGEDQAPFNTIRENFEIYRPIEEERLAAMSENIAEINSEYTTQINILKQLQQELEKAKNNENARLAAAKKAEIKKSKEYIEELKNRKNQATKGRTEANNKLKNIPQEQKFTKEDYELVLNSKALSQVTKDKLAKAFKQAFKKGIDEGGSLFDGAGVVLSEEGKEAGEAFLQAFSDALDEIDDTYKKIEGIGKETAENNRQIFEAEEKARLKQQEIDIKKSTQNLVEMGGAVLQLTGILSNLNSTIKNVSSGMMSAGDIFSSIIGLIVQMALLGVSLTPVLKGVFSTIKKGFDETAKGVQKVQAALGIVGLILAALSVVISIGTAIFEQIKKAGEASKEAAKAAKESAAELAQAYEDIKSKYEELKSTISNYESAKKGLEELTEGTTAWKEEIQKANEAALELIKTYPVLISKYHMENGAITFNDEALEKIQQEQFNETLEAHNKSIIADQAARSLEIQYQKEQVEKGNATKEALRQVKQSDKDLFQLENSQLYTNTLMMRGFDNDTATIVAGMMANNDSYLEKERIKQRERDRILAKEGDNKLIVKEWLDTMGIEYQQGSVKDNSYIDAAGQKVTVNWDVIAEQMAEVAYNQSQTSFEETRKNEELLKKTLKGMSDTAADALKSTLASNKAITASALEDYTIDDITAMKARLKELSKELSANQRSILKETIANMEVGLEQMNQEQGWLEGTDQAIAELLGYEDWAQAIRESSAKELRETGKALNQLSTLTGQEVDIVKNFVKGLGVNSAEFLESIDLTSDDIVGDATRKIYELGGSLDYSQEGVYETMSALAKMNGKLLISKEVIGEISQVTQELNNYGDKLQLDEYLKLLTHYGSAIDEYFVQMQDGTYALTTSVAAFNREIGKLTDKNVKTEINDILKGFKEQNSVISDVKNFSSTGQLTKEGVTGKQAYRSYKRKYDNVTINGLSLNRDYLQKIADKEEDIELSESEVFDLLAMYQGFDLNNLIEFKNGNITNLSQKEREDLIQGWDIGWARNARIDVNYLNDADADKDVYFSEIAEEILEAEEKKVKKEYKEDPEYSHTPEEMNTLIQQAVKANIISGDKASELYALVQDEKNLIIKNGESKVSSELKKAVANFEKEGVDTESLQEAAEIFLSSSKTQESFYNNLQYLEDIGVKELLQKTKVWDSTVQKSQDAAIINQAQAKEQNFKNSMDNWNSAIQFIENELSHLDALQNSVYGDQVVKNLEEQILLNEELIETLKEKAKVEEAERQRQFTFTGTRLTEDGNIVGGTAVEQQLYEVYSAKMGVAPSEVMTSEEILKAITGNEMSSIDSIESYNTFVEKYVKPAFQGQAEGQQAIKDFTDTVGKYFTTETEEAIAEGIRNGYELAIKKIDAKLQLTLDTSETTRAMNEFNRDFAKRDLIENQAITWDTEDLNTYTNDIGTLRNALREVDTENLSAEQALYKKQELRTKIQQTLLAQKEYLISLEEKQIEQVEELNTVYQEQIDYQETIYNFNKQNLEIQKLLYGENAYDKNNYDEAVTARQSQTTLAQEKLQKDAERIKKFIEDGGDTSSEVFKQMVEEYKGSINEWQSAMIAAIEEVNERYLAGIDDVFNRFENNLTNGKGLNAIKDEFDWTKDMRDKYLDNVNREFGISSFSRNVDKEININTSIKAQQDLNKLREDELETLRSKDKLTQYDLDRANKRLDILKAQIALEDAQQDKSQMRLVRGVDGSYGYQYVADANKIAEAEETLARAKNELYNMDIDEYEANLDRMFQLYEEYRERMMELASDEDGLTEEDIISLQKYTDEIQYMAEASVVAFDNISLELEGEISSIQDLTTSGIAEMAKIINNSGFTNLFGDFRTEITGEGGLTATWSSAIGIMQTDWQALEETISTFLSNPTGTEEKDKMQSLNDLLGIDWASRKTEAENYVANVTSVIEDGWNNMATAVKNYQTLVKQALTLEGEQMRIDKQRLFNKNNLGVLGWTEDDVYWNNDYIQNDDLYKIIADIQNAVEKGKLSFDSAKNIISTLDSFQAKYNGSNNSLQLFEDWYYAKYPQSNEKNDFISYGADEFIDYLADYSENNSSESENSDNSESEKKAAALATGAAVASIILPILGPLLAVAGTAAASKFDTGGYTGEWGPEGRIAVLHEKELVLKPDDTTNILSAVETMRSISNALNNDMFTQLLDKLSASASAMVAQETARDMLIEQDVHIEAVFPNVNVAEEIEAAFNDIIDMAAQRVTKNTRG